MFGSDLPTEGESGGKKKMRFAWRDGPFLKALKNSEWILLDEVRLSNCLFVNLLVWLFILFVIVYFPDEPCLSVCLGRFKCLP